jgi:hypothetical protein
MDISAGGEEVSSRRVQEDDEKNVNPEETPKVQNRGEPKLHFISFLSLEWKNHGGS